MTLRDRRFLVTGGSGFIGSALVGGLLREGAFVRSLDDDSRGRRRRLDGYVATHGARLELQRGDIRDAQAVSKATEGIDAVLHLAYVNGTEFFYSKPDLVLDVAVRGMLNVLDACRACGVKDFVLASSSEVYQTPPHVPTDETAPLSVPDVSNPRYSYGGGKIICELLALHSRQFDRVRIFRPHNCYGADMGEEHVIPQLARRFAALAKTTTGVVTLPIQGDGSETRSFVHVDDLVEAVLRIVDVGEHENIYHVGTEEEISIATLAEEIARCFGRDVRIERGARQPGGTLRRCPDTRKLRALGYAPRVSLRAGLARTVEWYAREGTTET